MGFLKDKFLKCLSRIKLAIEGYEQRERLASYKKVGSNVYFQQPYCHANPENISIGNHVSFAAFVHIWGAGGVEIGNNCMIASHCAITSTTHNPKNILFNSENIHAPVKIGNNVWIGAHVVIFPGVEIGDNVIVGAGSVVNKNLEKNAVYAGVPCRLLYKLERNETEN